MRQAADRLTPRSHHFCHVLVCAIVCTIGRPSHANGAFPAVSQLLIDPSDDRHLALRSNFGLMVSRDAGASWDWRCEAGLGYGNIEPPAAILNGGTLILGLPMGVAASDEMECDFRLAAGIHANVQDVSAVRQTPGAAVAVSVSYDDTASQVWQTSDNGRSFQARGGALAQFTALTLDVPGTLSNRVYVSGLLWAKTVEGALATSDDGGKSFAIHVIPNSDSGSQPFIAGLDPMRTDTVYVRLAGNQGRLLVSDDAGQTFRPVLSIAGPLQGFAISLDGSQVFASSLEAGLFGADAASLTFQRLACVGVPCLAATESALLGCGDRARNGFTVGRSVDHGQTFSALLDTLGITPANCPVTTSVGAACADYWPGVAMQLGQDKGHCDPSGMSPPANRDCFNDANSAGASGAEPSTAGSDGAPMTNSGGDINTAPRSAPKGSGCACSELGSWHENGGAVCPPVAMLFLAGLGRKSVRRRVKRTTRTGSGASLTHPIQSTGLVPPPASVNRC